MEAYVLYSIRNAYKLLSMLMWDIEGIAVQIVLQTLYQIEITYVGTCSRDTHSHCNKAGPA